MTLACLQNVPARFCNHFESAFFRNINSMKKVIALLLGLAAILPLCNGAASGEVGKEPKEFQKFATDLLGHFASFGWKDIDFENQEWEYHRKSPGNMPLFFTTFGKDSAPSVLFLGGVHGDESPSVYLLLKLAQLLAEKPELCHDRKVVIAPLVNPDGFFSRPQTRTNGRGVDINRNFPTKDWKQTPKNRYYSGPKAGSEPETQFQIALMNRFKPTHIVAIHSPLRCFDYDGPSSDLDSMVLRLKKVSKENGLPFRRYQVFPGSLGNYAGLQRQIHTLTLELPSAEPRKAPEYYGYFKDMFLDILELKPE